jgi:hypothetical protein
MLAHNVYFTLNEDSLESRQTLLDACQKYLTDHPGVVYYSVGTLVDDLSRPVNDKDFHVGLHVIFETRADHDTYQVSDRHVAFIEENKAHWKQVRVFDSSDD